MDTDKKTRAEFSKKTKEQALERAKGHCELCGKRIRPGDGPEYDHIITDFYSGGNSLANCQVLCIPCHGHKTHKNDAKNHAKSRRMKSKAAKTERKKKFMPYRLFDGTPVWNKD